MNCGVFVQLGYVQIIRNWLIDRDFILLSRSLLVKCSLPLALFFTLRLACGWKMH